MQRCTPIAVTASPLGDLPLWVKPTTLLTLSGWRMDRVTLGGMGPGLLAKADPKRVGIQFATGSGALANFVVSPDARPDLGGFGSSTSVPFLAFTIFSHGPMVCSEWYGFLSGGGTVTVYEWYRLA